MAAGAAVLVRVVAEEMTIYQADYAIEEIGDDTELSPILRDALVTWHSLRGDRELPPWSVQHFLEFPPKLLSLAVLATYDGASDGFRVRYWGSHRYDLHGEDYTGRLVSEIGPECIGEKLRNEYAEVRRARRPLKVHSQFKSRSQGEIRKYMLRLPFASEGEAVDGILSFDDPKQLTRRLFLAAQGTPPTWAEDDI